MPFFFVVTGAQIDLPGLGAWSLGRRSALIIGVGMIPRGDVGIIVASLGRQAGIIDQELYTLVIVMVPLTSVIAPPALAHLLARER